MAFALLKRMTREGRLASAWETPVQGHPRKYHRLSGIGTELLAAMRTEYEEGYAACGRIGTGGVTAGPV